MNQNLGVQITVFFFFVGVLTVVGGIHAWSERVASAHATPFSHVRPDTPEEIARELALQAEHDRIIKGGEHYKPLKMLVDFPGVDQPDLVDASESELPESTQIIGIEVDGQFCAIVLQSMLDPERHIVNMIFNQKPVSATYCNLVDCVRVLTDARESPIPLHVGGVDIDSQMVFLLDGQRYGQSSKGLPLADHQFDRMELGQWQRLHPTTRIYMGTSVRPGDS